MDSSFVRFAYKDQAFPIAANQTISQPYTVAFQTELLHVSPGDKILEVGTGSGYQTAILIELGAKVYSIERHKILNLKAKELLPKIGYNPHLFYGDGYKGLPSYGPFDKVLITAGAEKIPEQLLKQMKINGIMVIPLGNKHVQIMKVIKKTDEDNYQESNHGEFIFVPMLKGKQ